MCSVWRIDWTKKFGAIVVFYDEIAEKLQDLDVCHGLVCISFGALLLQIALVKMNRRLI